jgi:hypothetical protein
MSSLAGAVTHPFTADVAGAGAIYGAITAMAVVAGTDERAMSQVFVLVLGTLLVLWLGHTYAHTLARHIEHGGRATLQALRATLVEERSFLVRPSPMLVVLALGALDVLPDSADTISLWVGLVQLVSWGTRVLPPARAELDASARHRVDQRPAGPGRRSARGEPALMRAAVWSPAFAPGWQHGIIRA